MAKPIKTKTAVNPAFLSASEVDKSKLPIKLKGLKEYVFDQVEYDCRRFESNIKEWRDNKLFLHFNPTWEEFLSEHFSQTPEWVEHVIDGLKLLDTSKPVKASDSVAASKARAQVLAEAKPLAPHGENQHSKDSKEEFIIINSSKKGDSPEYLAARIARDAPEVQRQMKQGEFRSVRAAAIAAGIVKPRVQVTWKSDAGADAIASAVMKKIPPELALEVGRIIFENNG